MLNPKQLIDNFTNHIQSEKPFDWHLAVSGYDLGESLAYRCNDGAFGRRICLIAMWQLPIENSKKLWTVKMDDTWCLGCDGEYHFEPMPSSRTEKYIALTRFKSPEEAFDALIAHEKAIISGERKKTDLIFER